MVGETKKTTFCISDNFGGHHQLGKASSENNVKSCLESLEDLKGRETSSAFMCVVYTIFVY